MELRFAFIIEGKESGEEKKLLRGQVPMGGRVLSGNKSPVVEAWEPCTANWILQKAQL